MMPAMHSIDTAAPMRSVAHDFAHGFERRQAASLNLFANRGVQAFAAVVVAHAFALAALPNMQHPVRVTDPVIITLLQAPAAVARSAALPAAAPPSPRKAPQSNESPLHVPAPEALPVRSALADSPAITAMAMPRATLTAGAATPALDHGSEPPTARMPAASAYSAAPVAAPVTPPRFDAAYLDNPAPAYPAAARRLGEQGRVVLRVHVSADGLPRDIETATSSGSLRLDGAARSAVERWRFVPARQGEQAVAAWVLVPLTFTLGNS